MALFWINKGAKMLFDKLRIKPLRSKKQATSERLLKNRIRGQAGEKMVSINYGFMGYSVKRTGIGSDFEIGKQDLLSGKIKEKELIEVKTGNAKLSRLQKKTQKKKRNFREIRINPPGIY
ncbi:hypothetical protein HYU14_06895 [Candidatus Woesearchaeota archaeon]|nr:hypothetical protein [Candidatus Woesearchaeota archaeon]